MIPIGHRDAKARSRLDEDVGGSHNIVGDKIMRGTQVEEGNDGVASDLNLESHGQVGLWLNTHERCQGNLRFAASLWVLVVAVQVWLNFDDEETFALVVGNKLFVTTVA